MFEGGRRRWRESLIMCKIKAERNVSEQLSPSSGKRLALQSVVKIDKAKLKIICLGDEKSK